MRRIPREVLRESLVLNGGGAVSKVRCGTVRRRLRWCRGFPFAMWETSREPWADKGQQLIWYE